MGEGVAGVEKVEPEAEKRHFDPVPQTLALASILGHFWIIHNAGIQKP